ncbi:hypothetical protein HMPREF2822_08200 [Corynebacterium sp. HMSC062E11]|uniref:Transposase n=1 Tax=Corynebacterium minutissimum TaxID=38301 RepID=A0A376CUI3_9CORY|nr:hypothetical protein HMPREF2822_08200 [Corynebacterium sp. HMSC062E11]OFK63619.1 hypothetical protein HMPREF2808_07790 [Corynebacterium sp. HMSC078A10]OFM30831.1 hypothetical protein HMPREF2698_11110 [Corynebacterium sp. HMSC072A02]OFN17076.1 hypothetical protein HMPREF2604_09305 [Corynebacterium sp. HMSC055A01]OFN34298.1 hypothetical protein HMPREF2565_10195 [Corynebacterium sp. HMSC072A04]OFN78340.1 hypothetical protein HMPREF2537_06050 [Corynebacterium sp. HMSC074E01]OFP65220.1 hypothet
MLFTLPLRPDDLIHRFAVGDSVIFHMPINNELDAIFVDKRSSGQGTFVPIDFDAVVKARTRRVKLTL